MITDSIINASRYSSLHPDFSDAFTLLQNLDFSQLPDGQLPCSNPNIRIFIGSENMRTHEQALPEAHLQHIDIQSPISDCEIYGWIDRTHLQNGMGYQQERDIEFFNCTPEKWLEIQPGEFVLFFPNDGHAPLVGNQEKIRKVVFKIRTLENRI